MSKLDESLWGIADDFDDAPAPAPSQPPAVAPDDWDQQINSDLVETTQIPVVHSPPSPARRAQATAVSSNVDIDDGIAFGMDPDFAHIGSRTIGAAFELPTRDDVLRATHRTPDRSRRQPARNDEYDMDDMAAPLADIAAPDPGNKPTKAELREQRIAAAQQKRLDKQQDKADRKADRAQQRDVRRDNTDPVPSPGDSTKLHGAVPDSAKNRRRLLAGAGACAAALAVVGGIGYFAFSGDSQDSSPTVALPPSTTAPLSAPESAVPAADADCPTESSGNLVRGRDAGDLSSGAGAIKAFNYAYYKERDAAAAIKTIMPSSVPKLFTSVKNLQAGIDAVPVGTVHCLTITDIGDGKYTAEVVQTPPGGGAPSVFNQLIQTARTSSGTTLIVDNKAQ